MYRMVTLEALKIVLPLLNAVNESVALEFKHNDGSWRSCKNPSIDLIVAHPNLYRISK